MTRARFGVAAGAFAAALALASCGGFGRVNQGQVIAYDKAGGIVTVISDSNYKEPGKPRFDVLPPVAVRVPMNRHEMGPEPQAGRLLSADLASRTLTVYDDVSGALRQVPFTPVAVEEPVYTDDPRVSGHRFPVVNPAAGTVTIYIPSRHLLLAAALERESLALPAETWRCGDEVRYYYKVAGQALRLMNVTRTNLNKGGK